MIKNVNAPDKIEWKNRRTNVMRMYDDGWCVDGITQWDSVALWLYEVVDSEQHIHTQKRNHHRRLESNPELLI